MGQSPIKLVTDTSLKLSCPQDLLTIDYPPGISFPGVFKGDTAHGNFELTGPAFPLIRFRKRASNGNNWRTFKLVKVHIHKPAEHLVDSDEPAHFEVHFLHVPEPGTVDDPKVVIGVLFDIKESAVPRNGLEPLAKAMPSRRMLRSQNLQPAGTGHDITPHNFFPLLPGSTEVDLVNWFSYEGSLTSYPYSEDVTWFVMKNLSLISPVDAEPVECHAEQEARGLQPLDRRIVVRSF